jgi:aryl-alcohol dehydrogenase-like predicted oxidoreductase
VLEDISKANRKTISQVAVNWLLATDSCIIPIPGAKDAKQAMENAVENQGRYRTGLLVQKLTKTQSF